MDSLGHPLLVEYEARRRQGEIVAAADRWMQLGELPQESPLREGVAHLLVGLALWLAPERTLPEIRHAAAHHLAH